MLPVYRLLGESRVDVLKESETKLLREIPIMRTWGGCTAGSLRRAAAERWKEPVSTWRAHRAFALRLAMRGGESVCEPAVFVAGVSSRWRQTERSR